MLLDWTLHWFLIFKLQHYKDGNLLAKINANQAGIKTSREGIRTNQTKTNANLWK
jgi:hypothetical protein